MFQRLDHVDTIRKEVGRQISQERKAELGQFMTPTTVARFMAALFAPSTLQTARLLDAGAGIGSLSGAFLNLWASGSFDFQRLELTVYEIDAHLSEHLARTLSEYQAGADVDVSMLPGDFIEDAVRLIREGTPRFTHAILNPPYKKINSASRHRLLLRQVGIETVNLYSAFVALAIELIQPGGQIVAIIPRSFCNGPYYRPFRDLIFTKTAIKHPFPGQRLIGRRRGLKSPTQSCGTMRPKNGYIQTAIMWWCGAFHPKKKSAASWRASFIQRLSIVLC
jgi:adenine-specific DNA-methyltransferase